MNLEQSHQASDFVDRRAIEALIWSLTESLVLLPCSAIDTCILYDQRSRCVSILCPYFAHLSTVIWLVIFNANEFESSMRSCIRRRIVATCWRIVIRAIWWIKSMSSEATGQFNLDSSKKWMNGRLTCVGSMKTICFYSWKRREERTITGGCLTGLECLYARHPLCSRYADDRTMRWNSMGFSVFPHSLSHRLFLNTKCPQDALGCGCVIDFVLRVHRPNIMAPTIGNDV